MGQKGSAEGEQEEAAGKGELSLDCALSQDYWVLLNCLIFSFLLSSFNLSVFWCFFSCNLGIICKEENSL